MTKISSNYVAGARRAPARRRIPDRILADSCVARFCFARRISSRNGGWMKLQRYWIALVLASASDIRASFILLVGPAVIWPATLKF